MKRWTGSKLGAAQGEAVLFSDFEDGGPMWNGEGPRVSRLRVAFAEPFTAEPAVHVALAMWDISDGANGRADIRAEGITTEGFEIVFRTWADTRVARVRAAWLAVGPVRDDDDWDVS